MWEELDSFLDLFLRMAFLVIFVKVFEHFLEYDFSDVGYMAAFFLTCTLFIVEKVKETK